MLKEKQLNNDLTTTKSGFVGSIDESRALMEQIASQNSIPISVVKDTIKVGGLFNSQELGCLVVSNPEHERDYYKIVIVPSVGETTVATTGVSKQMKKFAIAEAAKAQRKGKSLSYKIGHAATSSLWLLGKSKNKLEAEQAYYDAVIELIAVAYEFQ